MTVPGAIYVGAGAVGSEVDYVNIDALVFAGIELLHENSRVHSPCRCSEASVPR
ncbi:hypothetical protein [Sphingomonas aurantiaca]|uniref:hypothetical protein n=1 Tax=Sphingomonas aurantiaca TaxID=185949 RepID=UPI001ABFA522|nr:hypothetical protein [Sphingomonas aurantiaca]